MKNFAKLWGFNSDKGEKNSSQSQQYESKGPVGGDHQEQVADHAGSDILQLSVSDIEPNPFQPRKTFNDESLQELAASIREYGVIQPLLVRNTPNGRYELVAGERRLRASRLSGLVSVPVIVKTLNDQEMAELAMIENLQREDLHFMEEAEGFQQLIANFGFTQDELAKRVGKNQSTIANKLRLLKLPGEVRTLIMERELTERHARALLKIENEAKQLEILNLVRENNLNVRETEQLIETVGDHSQNEQPESKKSKQSIVKIIRDARIFINTINKLAGDMRKAGLKVAVEQDQDDDFITINLKIPKRR